MDRDGKSRFSF